MIEQQFSASFTRRGSLEAVHQGVSHLESLHLILNVFDLLHNRHGVQLLS